MPRLSRFALIPSQPPSEVIPVALPAFLPPFDTLGTPSFCIEIKMFFIYLAASGLSGIVQALHHVV